MIYFILLLFLVLRDSNAFDNVNDILRTMSNPKVLNLRNSELNNRDIKLVAQILKKNQIVELDLSVNNLEDDQAVLVAQALEDSKVTSLFLKTNNIGNRGAAALAKLLPRSQIRYLNLRKNEIGPEGAEAIIKELKGSKLIALDLGDNGLGVQTVVSLAKKLNDSKIKYLWLSYNRIGDEGAKALAKVLNQTRITKLYLDVMGIRDEGVKAIARVLPETGITELHLRNGNKGEAILAVLNDTQVTTLDLSGSNDVVDSILKSNRDRIDKIYRRFKDFVGNVNGSLEFVLDRTSRELEYDEFVRTLARKKKVYGRFLEEDRLNHTRSQIEDFIENIETRFDKCFRMLGVVENLFDNWNRSLRFNVYEPFVNVFEYIELAEFIGKRKEFIPEGRIYFTKDQIKNFVETIGIRYDEFMKKLKGLKKQFDEFVVEKDGSLGFKVDEAFSKKLHYEEFAKIVEKNPTVYIKQFGKNYREEQIRNFVDNIQTRLLECLSKSKLIDDQFEKFVANVNESLEFRVEYAFANKLDYEELARIVERNPTIFIQRFGVKYPEKRVRNFVDNIQTRVLECLSKSQRIHDQFVKFVANVNESLEFKVDYAYSNKLDYEELARIVANDQSIFIQRFNTEFGKNYTGIQIESFVKNIKARVTECINKTEDVYSRFEKFVALQAGSFVFIKSEGAKDTQYDEFTEDISKDKESYINYLKSRGKDDRVRDFVNNIDSRLKKFRSAKSNASEVTRPFLVYVILLIFLFTF